MKIVLSLTLLLLFLVSKVYYLLMKNAVLLHEEKINWFWRRGEAVSKFREIMRHEKNKPLKSSYRRVLSGFYLLLGLLAANIVMLMIIA